MGRITFFIIGAILTSTVALATITGGSGGGLSQTAADALYARLAAVNTFVREQLINDTTPAVNVYSGTKLQTTGRASYCLGASNGASYEFCMSGGSVFQLHGGNPLYGTTVTGGQILTAQPQLSRVWLGPSSSVIVGGGNGVPDVSFAIGSNTEAAATLAVDTTNDWIKLLPISAPAASECDEADERGRIYYDSGTDKVRYCNGTAWTDL